MCMPQRCRCRKCGCVFASVYGNKNSYWWGWQKLVGVSLRYIHEYGNENGSIWTWQNGKFRCVLESIRGNKSRPEWACHRWVCGRVLRVHNESVAQIGTQPCVWVHIWTRTESSRASSKRQFKGDAHFEEAANWSFLLISTDGWGENWWSKVKVNVKGRGLPSYLF